MGCSQEKRNKLCDQNSPQKSRITPYVPRMRLQPFLPSRTKVQLKSCLAPDKICTKMGHTAVVCNRKLSDFFVHKKTPRRHPRATRHIRKPSCSRPETSAFSDMKIDTQRVIKDNSEVYGWRSGHFLQSEKSSEALRCLWLSNMC